MSHAKQLHNRRYLDDYLEIINRTGLPCNVRADVCQQVQAMVIVTVQSAIEQALEEELSTSIGCGRYVQVDFPRSLVSLIRTTNLLERFHKEVRRKQRDIGMFQSERGCEAVWYLIATRETAKQRAALVLRR